MLRSLCLSLCILVMLSFVSTSYGVVIGDFEGSLDGWFSNDGTLSQSTEGVTTGSGSMMLEAAGGWKMVALLDAKSVSSVLGNAGAAITGDFTIAADVVTSNWMQVQFIVNGQNNDDSGAHNNIGWQQGPQVGVAIDGSVNSVTWELPDDLTAKIAGIDDTIHWFEVVIVTNLDGASPMQMYADNIQVVPEPATMSLLGLGGLALLRRRK